MKYIRNRLDYAISRTIAKLNLSKDLLSKQHSLVIQLPIVPKPSPSSLAT